MPILSPDEISTIFVVGFPPDMKEREFQNLFMFASGFEGASLKVPDSSHSFDSAYTTGHNTDEEVLSVIQSRSAPIFKQQIIGFARFQRRQDALAARDHLNGRCIDAERGSILKVEMAKKNLFIAPRKASLHNYMAMTATTAIKCEEQGYAGDFDEPLVPMMKTTRSLSLSIPGNPAPIDISLPSALFSKGGCNEKPDILKQPTFIPPVNRSFSLVGGGNPSTNGMYILGENPPCNTLYVGNLPLNADEEELRELFAICEGYRRLSFKNKPNGPMCFIEFDDVACARKAMDSHYGTLLSSSTKGGIRLSYSKNPLGVRSATPNEALRPARFSDYGPMMGIKPASDSTSPPPTSLDPGYMSPHSFKV